MKYFLGVILAVFVALGAEMKVGNNEIILLTLEDKVKILPNYMIPISEINKNDPCINAKKKFVDRADDISEESVECAEIWSIYGDGNQGAQFNVLLVKNKNFNLLIDTGNASAIGKIKTALSDYDLSPKDITHIALSSAFSSHIGALGKVSKTFPNATLLLSKLEEKYWMKNGDELTKKRLKLYKNKAYFNGSWNFLDDSNITALAMPGKSPGFTIFKFSDELYYVADMLYSYTLEDKYPAIANIYDLDKIRALESRVEFYKMVLEYEKNNPGKKVKVLGTYINSNAETLDISEKSLAELEKKILALQSDKNTNQKSSTPPQEMNIKKAVEFLSF